MMRKLGFVSLLVYPLSVGCGGTNDKTVAPPANVPAALQVPGAPPAPRLHAFGRGAQIYTCSATSGGDAWVFTAPDATLFDDKQEVIGKHFAGPSWELDDGSKVVANSLQKVAAPMPARDIPWLLLQVTSESGAGALSGVRYVQRLDTSGGVAPVDGCSANAVNQEVAVDYTADYYFW
jgi:hypothetical protein